MENLHTLLHSHSTQEKETLKTFLSCFSSRKNSETKTLKLAELVLADEKNVFSNEYYSRKIFGEYKPDAFRMLKNRLYDKVYDCLLININLDRNEMLDETDEAFIRIKKKSALYTNLLYSKPSSKLLPTLLDEIIEQSKKWEYYAGAAEHLRYKKSRGGKRMGMVHFDKLDAEQKHYEKCASAVNRATDYFNRLSIMFNESTKPDEQKLNSFLEKGIFELTALENETKSATVNYYLQRLKYAHHNLNKDYLVAKSICHNVIEILKTNKSIFRNQRISFAYGELARCEIYLNNYSEAVQFAAQSEKHLPHNSRNLSLSIELLFLAQFHNHNFTEAQSSIDFLLSNALHDVGTFDYAKYSFYKASLLFAKGEFLTAKRNLNQNFKIDDDKAGWAVGIKILTILSHIETGNKDSAIDSIDPLNRAIQRCNEKNNPVSARDKQIFNALVTLGKCGFNFNELNSQGLHILETLSPTSGEYAWQPFTAELIPFHKWLNSKIKRKVDKHL